ncbi:hypothetical protein BGZ54_009317 [Gamsiella multidivaricata]|nr:hypothetical protein BGZ54_009317 [Gamsiella multidivaricata]
MAESSSRTSNGGKDNVATLEDALEEGHEKFSRCPSMMVDVDAQDLPSGALDRVQKLLIESNFDDSVPISPAINFHVANKPAGYMTRVQVSDEDRFATDIAEFLLCLDTLVSLLTFKQRLLMTKDQLKKCIISRREIWNKRKFGPPTTPPHESKLPVLPPSSQLAKRTRQ